MNAKVDISREDEIKKVKKIAENLKNDFLVDAAKFLSMWYTEKVNQFVESYPKIKQSLSEEDLKSIKKEVKELCKRADDLIIPVFGKEENWWHFGDTELKPKDFYKSINNIKDFEVRCVFGEIGKIFEDYGFIWKIFEGDCRGFQAHKDGSNLYYYEYVYPIYWSDIMKRKMDNYWENYKYFLTLTGKYKDHKVN